MRRSTAAVDLGLVPAGQTSVQSQVTGGQPITLDRQRRQPQETGSVFNALIKLGAALQNNDNAAVQRAMGLLGTSMQNLNNTRAELGVQRTVVEHDQHADRQRGIELAIGHVQRLRHEHGRRRFAVHRRANLLPGHAANDRLSAENDAVELYTALSAEQWDKFPRQIGPPDISAGDHHSQRSGISLRRRGRKSIRPRADFATDAVHRFCHALRGVTRDILGQGETNLAARLLEEPGQVFGFSAYVIGNGYWDPPDTTKARGERALCLLVSAEVSEAPIRVELMMADLQSVRFAPSALPR